MILCALYPLDKAANADGQRRRLDAAPPRRDAEAAPTTSTIAPLLRKLMADYAATGLPPAYLPPPEPPAPTRRTPAMTKKLLALYGLKWNPFAPEVPLEALLATPKVEAFCWRIEQSHVREGGFALITGDPGTGKSVVLRAAGRAARARARPHGRGARASAESASPTSTASSAISSASPSSRTTAGAGSRPCASGGWCIWRARCSVPCS